jgi:hypothetical protein
MDNIQASERLFLIGKERAATEYYKGTSTNPQHKNETKVNTAFNKNRK